MGKGPKANGHGNGGGSPSTRKKRKKMSLGGMGYSGRHLIIHLSPAKTPRQYTVSSIQRWRHYEIALAECLAELSTATPSPPAPSPLLQ